MLFVVGQDFVEVLDAVLLVSEVLAVLERVQVECREDGVAFEQFPIDGLLL